MDHAQTKRAKLPLPARPCAKLKGRRVVSVADMHGDFTSLLQLLQGLGLVRREVSENPGTWQNMWAGGDALFLQLGDVVDRGDEGQRMWKFLWALQDEQPASIILFIGNHETMLLTREYKYSNSGPSFADKCTYTIDPAGCKAQGIPDCTFTCADPLGGPANLDGCVDRAWSGDGFMGRQLQERMKKGQMKMAHLVADTVFVHAGVTLGALRKLAKAGALGDSREKYTEVMNALALHSITEQRRDDFFLTDKGDGLDVPSKDGPTWTRNYAWSARDNKLQNNDACREVFAVLKVLGAKRMVKGHDPTVKSGTAIGEARALCQGTLFLTDTLMSEGYTRDRRTSEQNLMAFETSTEGDDRRFVYPMRQHDQCSGRLITNAKIA